LTGVVLDEFASCAEDKYGHFAILSHHEGGFKSRKASSRSLRVKHRGAIDFERSISSAIGGDDRPVPLNAGIVEPGSGIRDLISNKREVPSRDAVAIC
jgi:hypothetical protein